VTRDYESKYGYAIRSVICPSGNVPTGHSRMRSAGRLLEFGHQLHTLDEGENRPSFFIPVTRDYESKYGCAIRFVICPSGNVPTGHSRMRSAGRLLEFGHQLHTLDEGENRPLIFYTGDPGLQIKVWLRHTIRNLPFGQCSNRSQ